MTGELRYDYGYIAENLDEVYSRLLWPQGRGFPLNPHLDELLPPEYLKYGIQTGDVGAITSQGYFEFYFNIFLPATHPINKGRVPEGFVPLRKNEVLKVHHNDVKVYESQPIKFNMETQPSQPPVVKTQFTVDWPDTESAILILPEGFHSEDLREVEDIRRYVSKHAIDWYHQFWGRELVNGALHVVTGHDKASYWIKAAIEPSFPDSTFTRKLELTSSMHQEADRCFYKWASKQSGGLEVDYAPDPVRADNQSVFVRSFCIQLSQDSWNDMVRPRRRGILGFWDYLSSFGGERITVTALFKPRTDVAHPSRRIASYLLKKSRNAKLAIVHQNDWKLLMENDEIIPENDELIHRVEAKYVVETDQDTKAVYLISTGFPG